MTSSPGPMPSASSARCNAAVAEFRAIAWRAPTFAANRSSNSFACGPVVSQPGIEDVEDGLLLPLRDRRACERKIWTRVRVRHWIAAPRAPAELRLTAGG